MTLDAVLLKQSADSSRRNSSKPLVIRAGRGPPAAALLPLPLAPFFQQANAERKYKQGNGRETATQVAD